MKKYTVKLVSQEDGSSILPLPDEFVKKFGMEIGDPVEITPRKEGGFILKPSKKKYKLKDLVDDINQDNRHDEIDFGEAQGNEK